MTLALFEEQVILMVFWEVDNQSSSSISNCQLQSLLLFKWIYPSNQEENIGQTPEEIRMETYTTLKSF